MTPSVTQNISRTSVSGSGSGRRQRPTVCYHTLHGMHHWYSGLFEKFAWVMLAHQHGEAIKVASYMDSIGRLESTLRQKVGTTDSVDKVGDLEIMLNNIRTLRRQALRTFKS